MAAANKAIKVKIQWGVMGYVHSEEEFNGDTLAELIFLIKRRMIKITDELIKSDDLHGDLRGYVPQNANGYPTLAGIEPEWGDDINGYIMSMTVNGKVCEYRSKGQSTLRRELGLN
jgi:hypothetical protein